MNTEEKNDTETQTKGIAFDCCNLESFKKMFEMMNKCCPGHSDYNDFSAMMKSMMGMCSGAKTGDKKKDCGNC